MIINEAEPTLKALTDQIQTLRLVFEQQQAQIKQQNEQLQVEIAHLKANQTGVAHPQTLPIETKSSRRKLLKRLALLGLGATAATTALATTNGEASAAAIGTVSGDSTKNYGLTAAPSGVNPLIFTTGSYGLVGMNNQFEFTGAGVYGFSFNGNGVHGDNENGSGVYGTSVNSFGGRFMGRKATLRLDPFLANPAGIPSTGVHSRGELVASNEIGDATNLYFSTQGNNTALGTWVRLNQPYVAGNNITISPRNPDGTFTISATGGSGTGGSNIVFLTSPVRIAASTNSGGTLPLLSSDGTGNPNATFQAIQITGSTIPANAKGIIGSLTSVGATKPGNLRLWATGTPTPTVNTLNIPAKSDGTGFNLTTSFTVGLGTGGKVNIGYSGGVAGANCGFSLDVVAYIV
jgi:hypothetical protein